MHSGEQPELEQIVSGLAGTCPDAVEGREESGGDLSLIIRPDRIRACCLWLKENTAAPFNLFLDICGVDHFPDEPRFSVIYHLYAFPANLRLRLKVNLPSDNLDLESVAPVWRGADWFEREVYDMFGIRFLGHPDLRRILCPEEYGDHPLRKDFPLTGKFRIESPDDLSPWATGPGKKPADTAGGG